MTEHKTERPGRGWLMVGGALGLTGVAAGAFGAHALRERLTPEMLAVFETGARYHLIHALAVIAAAWIVRSVDPKWGIRAAWLFTLGVAVFSGSLYALALSGVRGLGAVTPVGGVLLLAGWAALILAGSRRS